MGVGAVGDNLLSASALRSYTRHKEEIVRAELPDLLQFIRLGSTDDKHHVLWRGDLHHLFHNHLIERLATFLCCLEIDRGRI